MTTGFDLDEIERRARAFLFQECQPDRGDVFSWMDDRMADFIRYALHNSAPAMITEIRELRAENARLRSFAGSLEIQGPDDDDLIWLVLRGNDIPTGGQAMVCLGGATPGIMGQLATAIEQDRRAALGEPQ